MSVETGKTVIHATAIVHPEADIGSGVTIGPYAMIDRHVVIGDGTTIGPRVTVEGHTTLGRDNEVFTGAVLGSVTQDKKYKGGTTYLRIGDRNKIREFVTINPGTDDGTQTVLGDDNLVMAYAHVAHNCLIGNHTIIANAGTLAGHVIMEDRAIVGGLSGIHQFVKVGYLAIIGGNSKVVQDVPPFVMVDGHPAKAFGLNSVGLDRMEVEKKDRGALKKAFRTVFRSRLSIKSAIRELQLIEPACASVDRIISFLEASDRGICK